MKTRELGMNTGGRRPGQRPGLGWARLVVGVLLGARAALGQTTPVDPQAGLWMGDITIQSVSRPQGNMEAVSRPAQLRILLHVDGAGVVRLLKEVIVTQSPTSATDVWLFTEPGRLAGKPVPRDLWSAAKAQRFATVAFDFEDNDGTSDNALQLAGRLAQGDKVEGTLVLGPNHPSNPFRHKYHPDHANTGASAYEIRREVQIQVVTPPRESGGVVQILASYTETLRGLHRAGLTTQGLVQFTRISNAATLNP